MILGISLPAAARGSMRLQSGSAGKAKRPGATILGAGRARSRRCFAQWEESDPSSPFARKSANALPAHQDERETRAKCYPSPPALLLGFLNQATLPPSSGKKCLVVGCLASFWACLPAHLSQFPSPRNLSFFTLESGAKVNKAAPL